MLVAGDRRYPIINGVPCFLTREQQIAAKQGFTPMWRYRQEGKFERQNLYGIKPTRKAEWVATKFHSPVRPGEWLMDAGCGSSEMTYVLARNHPAAHVVGLEFSDAVRSAAQGSEALPNLHFVQADVAHPPFRQREFGHVLSLGVLHHTPDTRAALQGTAGLVARGGELLVWLYPAAGESFLATQLYFMRDVHFLGAGHKMAPETRLKAAKLYSLGMMPAMTAAYSLYKVISKFGGKPEEKVISEDMTLQELYRTTTFAVYDNISPKFQHRHCKDEILRWFRELGFEQVETDGHGAFTGRMTAAA
jgi:ubiquinone/menaquinone biosynthesis C-methylase UbiE